MHDWNDFQVGDHIHFLSGFPFESQFFSTEDGTPLIRIRDLSESAIETKYRGSFDRKWLVRPGDILIGMDGDFSIVRWRNREALLNQRILKAESKQGGRIDEDFFFYWCGPRLDQIHARTAATTVKHLSIKDLEKATGRFPKIEDQQRIAEILSTVDEAIEQTEALIAKTQQIKVGLMHDLFTRGVTSDGQLRPPREEAPQLYKESPLGWIPKEWDCLRLGSLLHDITYGLTVRPVYREYGVPLISTRECREGWIDYEAAPRISEADFRLLRSRSIPSCGDVLFTKTGTLGRVARIRKEDPVIALSQNVALLKPVAERIRSDYLENVLRGDSVRRQVDRGASVLSVADLQLGVMERFLVPVAPIPEQGEVVNRIEGIDRSVAVEEKAASKLLSIRNGLMTDLLTGRVPVSPTAATNV